MTLADRVPVPARMLKLKRDSRGYPYPWNLLEGAGGPIFTANCEGKHKAAILLDLCPICGDPQDKIRWFVGSPSMFKPNRAFMDLPGHGTRLEDAAGVELVRQAINQPDWTPHHPQF